MSYYNPSNAFIYATAAFYHSFNFSTGVSLDQVKPLVYHIIAECPHLHFQGLLTLGHLTDISKTLECFQNLERLKRELGNEFREKWPTIASTHSQAADSFPSNEPRRPYIPEHFELSMGMSGMS